MVKRRKIGLIYKYDENWIGGTYYIENLITALNVLPEALQPELTIFVEEQNQFDDLKKRTGYPFLERVALRKLNPVKKGINRVVKLIFGKSYFFEFEKKLDLIFPAANIRSFLPNQQFLYWIPDFQEHHLVHFFTPAEIATRKKYQTRLVGAARYIVFSSKSVENDFNTFYPNNKVTQFVLPFAVTHPALSFSPVIIEKYAIPDRFFFCCNQLWIHKNHAVVIRAIHALKQQGHSVFVAFTGKEYDLRNPAYFKELNELIDSLEVQDQVKFLGFISREDQLALMKKAIAVLQPSLFEGWSTVIEDAKALQVKVIASNIDVHKEQLVEYQLSALFSPSGEEELAKAMLAADAMVAIAPNYKKNIVEFADKFRKMVEAIATQ